jgi:hypothetical protein
MALRERAALESWPDRRIGLPSSRSEPKASASAVAQSMPSPDSIALRRLSRKRWIVLWTSKSAGTSVSFLPISFSVFDRHAGLAATRLVLVVGPAQARPGAVEPVGLVGLVGLADLELGFEMRTPVGAQLVELGLGDQALGDQLVGIDLHRGLMGADVAVHHRLGEAGSSPSLWPKRR